MDKTKLLLYYLISKHPRASVTVLMKLAYLIDLVAIKTFNKQITDFEYRRYFYGPFDSKIYQILEKMQAESLIKADVYFTSDASYAVYSIQNSYDFTEFPEQEKTLVDETIADLLGYGARALTEIAYETKPMKDLGATLGGTENLNKTLKIQ